MGEYVHSITDAKYALLTADTGTTGPSYSAAVDIPGIRRVEMTEDLGDEAELRGDGGVLAKTRETGTFNVELEYAGTQAAVLAALLDMKLVTEGSGATEVKTLFPKKTPNLPFFKLMVQGLARDGGDKVLIIYKLKLLPLTVPTVVYADGEFQTTTLQGTMEWTVSTIADAAHGGVGQDTNLLFDLKARATAGAGADS